MLLPYPVSLYSFQVALTSQSALESISGKVFTRQTRVRPRTRIAKMKFFIFLQFFLAQSFSVESKKESELKRNARIYLFSPAIIYI